MYLEGLGFRSILNWAKKVHIYSVSKEGTWSFSFSRESAERLFNTLDEQKKQQARRKAQNNEQYPVATLRCPTWEDVKMDLKEYTTVITIDLKDDVQEEIKLDIECRDFLLFLEHSGIITATTREIVIDRAMAIETDILTLDDLKWTVLLVLLSQSDDDVAFTRMEDIVYELTPALLH